MWEQFSHRCPTYSISDRGTIGLRDQSRQSRCARRLPQASGKAFMDDIEAIMMLSKVYIEWCALMLIKMNSFQAVLQNTYMYLCTYVCISKSVFKWVLQEAVLGKLWLVIPRLISRTAIITVVSQRRRMPASHGMLRLFDTTTVQQFYLFICKNHTRSFSGWSLVRASRLEGYSPQYAPGSGQVLPYWKYSWNIKSCSQLNFIGLYQALRRRR